MAELLAVSPRVYTRRENGDATSQFATVVKIDDMLNVTLNELAGRQESGAGGARTPNPELHRLYQKEGHREHRAPLSNRSNTPTA